uniref:Genome polyprotein n=1 Tax=Gypsywort waikavirus TaxID=3115789 RepID=A0AAT9JB34_9SECO
MGTRTSSVAVAPHASLTMSNPNRISLEKSTTASHETLSSSFVVDLGVHVRRPRTCLHSSLNQRERDLTCVYCNLNFVLYQAFVKSKGILSRKFVSTLINRSFDSFYFDSLNLCTFEGFNATRLTSSRTGCQHVGPFLGVSGVDPKTFSRVNSWNICDNAEHLFECLSLGDAARGELFATCRKSNCWYATCTQCGASCQFTTARSQTLIALFFHFLELRLIENTLQVRAVGSAVWVPLSKSGAFKICQVLGLPASWFSEIAGPVKYQPVGVVPDITLHVVGRTYDMFGRARYATTTDILCHEGCQHSFCLTSRASHEIQMSTDMLRLFLLLLKGDGYLGARDDMGNVVEDVYGIVSIGGLCGVHAFCNEEFYNLHKRFYEGGFCNESENGSISYMNRNALAIDQIEVPVSLVSGFHEFSCAPQMEHGTFEEFEESIRDDGIATPSFTSESGLEREDDLEAQLRAFMENDEPLFVIDTVVPRVQGRGLISRVGGVLKGISNCVEKLHAVWDWPLEQITKGVKSTGEWLEENKEHVSKNVWACQMCETLQADQAKSATEIENALSLIRKAVEKLSGAVDSMSNYNNKKLLEMQEKVNRLESEMKGLESANKMGLDEDKIEALIKNKIPAAGVDLTDRVNKNTSLIKKIYDLMQDGLKRIDARIDELKRDVDISQTPFNPPQPIQKIGQSSGIGEHLPVTRLVKKQMAITEDEIPYAEEEVSLVETGEIIERSGVNSLHNAVGARHLVARFTWSVKSGQGKVLASVVMPHAIIKMNPRMENFFSYFQYYTCDGLEFEITMTSIPMQGGTLYVAWDTMSCASRQKIDSVAQLSGLPGIYVHASTSAKATFVVPNSSIQHMMCLGGSEKSVNELGTLKICCANVLNAPAEASQNVSVNVWAKFLNPVLSFYTLKHELTFAQRGDGREALAQLGELEAIVAMGKWSTTSAANLCELVVHPTCSMISDGVVTQTPLSVVSHVFARWSGSIIFRFIFGASAFVKGKLMVTAIPVQFRETKLTIDQMSSFPCEICDLSGEKREFEFTVPYHSIGKNSLVCRNALFDVSSYDAELVTTRLHVIVLDALVMNANASNSISYVVTQRPGKDFKLEYPCGIHAETVVRVISQADFQPSLSCRDLIGKGYDALVNNFSYLASFTLDAGKRNALCYMVSPVFRSYPPCVTQLSWLAQIFVQWSGTLVYSLKAHSFNKASGCYARVWYEPNGSTVSQNDFEFVTGVDPPAGTHVTYWFPSEGPIEFAVPFSARTEKLLINRARYEQTGDEWLQCFNGCVYIDYEGDSSTKLSVELSIKGGGDFQMFDRTVAPRCGNVTEAFTKLSYAKQLRDIGESPIFKRDILRGPFSGSTVDPIAFKPVKGVDSKGKNPVLPELEDSPEEGDEAVDDDGTPLVYRNGMWDYADLASKQMDWPAPFSTMNKVAVVADEFTKRETSTKIADIVDKTHEFVNQCNFADHELIAIPELVEAVKLLVPLLKSASKVTEDISDKMSIFEEIRVKILSVLMPLIRSSLPCLVFSALENEKYVWATIATLVGGSVLCWLYQSKKKFVKKFACLVMVLWAPFVMEKAFALGMWIKEKWFGTTEGDGESCRKHALAGLFEGVGESARSFSGWFTDNWTNIVQSLLSVLGVVASLVVWGTIPDKKKLNSFSEMFKEVGEKGKTLSNICGGFNSINKLVKEWSEKFMNWLLSYISSQSPSADSTLQKLLSFSVADWVDEVRDFSLLENRFVGFGCDDHLIKVRKLYDRSVTIEKEMVKGCKVDMALTLILKENIRKCRELLNESYTFKGMKKPRVDPLHICLYGGPGVGKSSIAHVMINDILDHRGVPEVDRIFTRCCADAYWSNYHQEPVILYDDLGAIKSGIKLSDYAEIMGIKSNDPFSVPMAGVEEKGRHCTSEFVFTCTNHLHLDDTGDVTTKNAFYRRRDLLVEVSRDPLIPKDPSDPTKGMLFSILGHKYTGADDSCVEFNIKTEWPEVFFQKEREGAVDETRNWYYQSVDYPTFLEFANFYADRYFENQHALLKGINRRRSTPAIPVFGDFADSQMEKQCVSLKDLEEAFNGRLMRGKDICALIGDRECMPEKWNTSKVVTLEDLERRMCECSLDKISCSYSVTLKQVCNALTRSIRRGSVVFPSVYKITKMGTQSCDVQFETVKGAVKGLLDDIDLRSSLSSLLIYRSWLNKDPTKCPYYVPNVGQVPFRHKLDCDDIDYDDRVESSVVTVTCGDNIVVPWEAIGKFFPQLISKFGFVSVLAKDSYIIFCEDVFELKEGDISKAGECWTELLQTGLGVSIMPLQLLNNEGRQIGKLLFNDINKWDFLDYTEERCATFGKALNVIGANGIYYVYCLSLVCEVVRRREAIATENITRVSIQKFIKSHEDFGQYKRELCGIISGKLKVGLAIAGGIVATGALAGMCFGIKKIIDGLFDLFKPAKKEKCIGVTEVIVSDQVEEIPIVCEELEPELSAANASANYHTPHPSGSKLITRQRKIGKNTPGVRVESQAGFGITYSEVETVKSPVVLKRRLRRREFINAISHISSTGVEKKTKGKPTVLRNLEFIKKKLDNQGVNYVQFDEFESLIRSGGVEQTDVFEPPTVFLNSSEAIEVDNKLIEVLKSQITQSKKNALDVINVKKVGKVHKQLQVGKTGLEKDQNMGELLNTHVSRMSCVIFNTTKSVHVNVLRLVGSIIVIPAHYLEVFEESDECYFICPSAVIKISCEMNRIVKVGLYQDLLVWDLGSSVPPSRDFMGHIMNIEDWKHYTTGSGVLSMCRYDTKIMMQHVQTLDLIEKIQADTQVPSGVYEMFGSNHTILFGLRYRVHSIDGFCGAAILRADPKAVRKIMGLHVAGHSSYGVGYAEMLIYESLMAAVSFLRHDPSHVIDGRHLEESPVELCSKQCEPFEGSGSLGLMGMVAPSEVPSLPSKSSIRKSLIHGLIGPIQSEPSILSKYDYRLGEKKGKWDPVLDAVCKYGVEVHPFPQEDIWRVEEHLSLVFTKMENNMRKREVNNLEIGINGIDGSEYWSPIEMKTSSGWPYCKRKPPNSVGKKWLFKEVGLYESGRAKYEMDDEGLKESYQSMLNESSMGIAPCVVTMECPKDERRKLKKIYDTPATRTFTILPPEVNILFRQYFGDFAAMVMSNRFNSFCQVGINPETLEWSELMNSFLKISDKGFAGDYAKFDGVSPGPIYHSIVNIINSWYDDGEENATIRHSLLNAIVHRNGIAGDRLLQYNQGMPSGFAMTVIFNSFVNYYFMALAWMSLVSNSIMSPHSDLVSFDRFCRIIVYGDDNVVAVHTDFLPFFNLRTVASFLSEYGITYTDDAKNPIHLSEPFVDITTTTFLKRDFSRVETKEGVCTLWKARLDKSSITERCNWIRECPLPEEALSENVVGALYEASIWGENYFDELYSTLSEAYDRVMLEMPLVSYVECQKRWWASMTGSAPSQSVLFNLVKLGKNCQVDLGFKCRDILLDEENTLIDLMRKSVGLAPLNLIV